MRLILCVVIVALMSSKADAACSEVDHCDSCSNPPIQCDECPDHYVLSTDETSCIACGTGCDECDQIDDVVSCTECLPEYYLDVDVCAQCPDGCTECHVDDTTADIHCDTCKLAYVMDPDTTDCIACAANCAACTLNDDLTTTCTACNSYMGLDIKGYFLKSEDKSCKACPSNCETCSDNGEGVGLCSSCFDGYVSLVDPDDSSNDKTQCKRCPSECSTCTGEDNGGVATCTACEAESGLYLTSGACEVCDENCLTCDDTGACEVCEEEYYVDGGSCSSCPGYCLTCSADETTGDMICDVCDDGYGTKTAESITCDSCTISNCDICTRATDGTKTCTECKEGYGLHDNKCTACASGCATCDYFTSDHWRCKTCEEGYASAVDPVIASSVVADPSLCIVCDSTCVTCGATATTCLSCAAGSDLASSACTELIDNAVSYDGSNFACKEGYFYDSPNCAACEDGGFCDTCSAVTDCDTCLSGYTLVDTDASNSTNVCESCGINNCDKCIVRGGYEGNPKKCVSCNTGYAILDAGGVSNSIGTSCKKCPSNCDDCEVDYTDSDKTKCNVGGCAIWDDSKAYTNGLNGACVACSTACKSCTFDDTEETVACASGECDDLYALNEDTLECDPCPDNCESCEWDSSKSSVVCVSTDCAPNYGFLAAEGECGECPAKCLECSQSGTTDDTTLYCDTCDSGYVRNEGVCGACGSNCLECSDVSGTMTCTKCKDHYALASDKTCSACPANCELCSTSKCTECMSGYSLTQDGTCTDCGTAAFTNCIECGDLDESNLAECYMCTAGYVLEDEAPDKSCTSAASLTCNGGTYSDDAAMCDTCSAGFEVTDDDLCAKMCYQCGDPSTGTYVEKSECVIPTAGSNSTDGQAELVECLSGICYGAYKDGKVMGGCYPTVDDVAPTCAGAEAEAETCATVEDVTVCSQCCTDSECNDFVPNLDGIAGNSASTTAGSLVLLIVAFIFAN